MDFEKKAEGGASQRSKSSKKKQPSHRIMKHAKEEKGGDMFSELDQVIRMDEEKRKQQLVKATEKLQSKENVFKRLSRTKETGLQKLNPKQLQLLKEKISDFRQSITLEQTEELKNRTFVIHTREEAPEDQKRKKDVAAL